MVKTLGKPNDTPYKIHITDFKYKTENCHFVHVHIR